MTRPAGVTVSAVLLILASAFFLLFSGLMLWGGWTLPDEQASIPYAKQLHFIAAAFYFGAALWGCVTAVGLLRLRGWARICILCQSGLAVFMLGMSLLMIFMVPIPISEDVSEGAISSAKHIAAAAICVPFALAVWWLIYFNLPSVKAVFLSGAITIEFPTRPLSISVIAWHAIVLGAIAVPGIFSPWPTFFFGIVLKGWAARMTYFVFGLALLAIGIGLLKLKPWSHTAAVGFCLLMMAHSLVVAFLPDKFGWMAEFVQYYPPELRRSLPVFPESLAWIGLLVTSASFGTVLWYLFTRKKAFLEAGKAVQSAA